MDEAKKCRKNTIKLIFEANSTFFLHLVSLQFFTKYLWQKSLIFILFASVLCCWCCQRFTNNMFCTSLSN